MATNKENAARKYYTPISEVRVENSQLKKEIEKLKLSIKQGKGEIAWSIKNVRSWPPWLWVIGIALAIGITILLTGAFNNKNAKKFNTTEISRLKNENGQLQRTKDSFEKVTYIDSLRLSDMEAYAERQKQITDLLINGNEAERQKIYKQLNEKINSNSLTTDEATRRRVMSKYY